MISRSKEYCIEVWGDYACFTRPEFKVERVSYDVITPSAARSIFEAIFFKPYAMRWQVTKIEVMNPIKMVSLQRCEVGAIASSAMQPSPIDIKAKRQIRNTMLLRDVRYRLYARLIFIPVKDRPAPQAFQRHKPLMDERPKKYFMMFERRAALGQCFNQPYLGTREFSAYYKLLSSEAISGEKPIAEDQDFNIMLYDKDYHDPKDINPMFYRAVMKQGVIKVPPRESKEVLK